MPVSVPDLGAFSTAEKQNLLSAIKAEVLLRLTPGSVRTGASAGQSFGVDKWSEDALTVWLNALTVELGYAQPEIRVRPNFGAPALAQSWPSGYAGSAVTCSDSRIEPDIATWADLAERSTTGMPDGTNKIWIEAATGLTKTTRLLPGTDATDTANGIQRPNDYGVGNYRVWYLAAS